MTVRADRMVQSAPPYYQFSSGFTGLQQAKADELDRLAARQTELALQFNPLTATWGLKYWEEGFHAPVIEQDSYEIRRSRVVSAWRGIGAFSATLIKSMCEAFTNGEVAVAVNAATSEITITFIGVRGIPPNVDDLKYQIDNVMLAHLVALYAYTYLYWNEIDLALWDTVDTYTWNQLETTRFSV